MPDNLAHAVERIQDSGWSPYVDEPALPDDEMERAKYESAARLVSATFSSPAGRKTLDWLIGSFHMRMSEPDNDTQAAFRAGQSNVVTQILYQMHIAKEGLKHG